MVVQYCSEGYDFFFMMMFFVWFFVVMFGVDIFDDVFVFEFFFYVMECMVDGFVFVDFDFDRYVGGQVWKQEKGDDYGKSGLVC